MKKAVFILAPVLGLMILALAMPTGSRGSIWHFWNTDSISGKLTDRVKVGTELEFRWREDKDKHFYYKHAQIGLEYKVNDYFSAGAAYRQVDENTKDPTGEDWFTEYRPMVNLTGQYTLEGWKLKDRLRISYRVFDIDKDDVWRFRNKFYIYSPWKFTSLKINPYVADEIFLEEHKPGIYRNRFYVGVGLKIVEHVGGGLFYLWQTDNKGDEWASFNVAGLQVKFSF